jgi:hypothetical protein
MSPTRFEASILVWGMAAVLAGKLPRLAPARSPRVRFWRGNTTLKVQRFEALVPLSASEDLTISRLIDSADGRRRGEGYPTRANRGVRQEPVFTELAADAQREGRKHQDERLPLRPADHPELNDFRDGLGISRVDGIEKNHSVVTKIRTEEWAALALRFEVDFHRTHGVSL